MDGSTNGEATAVELTTADGLVLRGQRFGGGATWAVLVHGEGGDLDAWRPLVGELLALPLAVLAIDLRGHGASDDPWRRERAIDDMRAACGFAQRAGARSLVLVGAGIGATAALAAAGEREDVAALALLSPLRSLPGLDPEALRESTAPKLIVSGPDDEGAAWVHAQAIGWSVLQTPPVPQRGTELLRSEWGDHVVEHVAAFLGDYVT